ncbi:cadmium-translocating P-type ATPase [Methylosinus sporium]|uniref:Cadmium-translocating P-type ATPase n=1 Tax=Methylosinus sporium TaxID=428 RepID=A0A549T4K4_METSR|nr:MULTISPECIES: heavy metal translocating P-type ATPase [Methylosinus]MBU3889597.1 cadmium-translocating P-type ATPase [Methylosinus sp. KRF6]TRL36826.1 cadmium-translocating P-type ATPase [Methylosinus sporium]
MTMDVDFSTLATHGPDGARRLELALDGMTCAACIFEIEAALKAIPDLTAARVNYADRRLSLEWAAPNFDFAAVSERLRRMGYRARPFERESGERAERETSRRLLRCLAVAAFASVNVMMLSEAVWLGGDMDATTRDFFHGVSALIALPAAAFAGQPFFASAFAALRAHRLNIDVPISLGVLLSLAMSVYETLTHAPHAYFDSATMLLAFLLLARYLDCAMRRKTRAVAANLAALRAPAACRLGADGAQSYVPLAALAPGDHALVRPGERIPADGVVLSGDSRLDESLVTGETRRRSVGAGDTVYAGAMNFDGALTICVQAATGDSLIDEIERLLDKATAARSRYRRLADRVARLYAPLVHLAALCTALAWLLAGASLHDALTTAIAVLIVTCPCALALAVPAVQVAASGALFRAGVLLNSADALERLAEIDTVVFDKTGTLTTPEPRVANAQEIEPELLMLAARLAHSSRHPLARAVAREYPRAVPLEGAREEQGAGVVAIVDGIEARLGDPCFCGVERDCAAAARDESSVIAFRHGERSAALVVRQTLRRDARDTIDALTRRGLRIIILSGDRTAPVEAAARALDVAEWRGAMKPADKVARLEALRAQGRKVLMIGDGVNDAPALAAAHVSLSPIDAAQIAQAAADAVFLGEELAPIVTTVDAARRARALMRQNLALSLLYNAVAAPLAMAGLLTPLIAALAMSSSSLIVTLNASRAGRVSAVRELEGARARSPRTDGPNGSGRAGDESRDGRRIEEKEGIVA